MSRRSPLPGPSSLHRVAACPTSEALPHARSSSQHSERGDVVHAFLEACLNEGKETALEKAPAEHREMLALIPLEQLPPLDAKHAAAEVSFALNVATGECRELGRGLTREEAQAKAKPGEMVGTADWVGLTPDAVVIYDWKSGRGHVDRAEVNWQTKTYSLMAARTYGLERARGGIVRTLDDGTVWYDASDMDALDLDTHAAELRALMAQRDEVLDLATVTRPPLHEGEHCTFCPALPFCPAKVALLTTAFGEGEPLATETVELTPERAARAWARILSAEKLLERLKAVVKDYGRQSPFSVGDGYVVGEVTEHRETLVAERVRGVLEKGFGPQLGGAVYSESVESKVSVTKTKLRAALSKLVLPTLPKEKAKITRIEATVHESLRAAGAVSVASFQHVKEHKPKEEPKKEPAQLEQGRAWDALSPEARIEFARVPDMGAAQAWDAERRKARDERIRACEVDGGHQWGAMGACVKCGLPKPPVDGAVEASSGHPFRHGVRLCSCPAGANACVDAPVLQPGMEG